MKYQFKTNINCGGCIKAVTPHLNGANDIQKWQVDTTSPDKILSVETESLTAKEVADLIKKAGFDAEEIN